MPDGELEYDRTVYVELTVHYGEFVHKQSRIVRRSLTAGSGGKGYYPTEPRHVTQEDLLDTLTELAADAYDASNRMLVEGAPPSDAPYVMQMEITDPKKLGREVQNASRYSA